MPEPKGPTDMPGLKTRPTAELGRWRRATWHFTCSLGVQLRSIATLDGRQTPHLLGREAYDASRLAILKPTRNKRV